MCFLAQVSTSNFISAINQLCEVKARSIVTIHRFKDVEELIKHDEIDLVVLGHENRFFGVYSSFSFEFINYLTVDVLVIHIPAPR